MSEWSFCPHCGGDLPSEVSAEYCPGCGSELSDESPSGAGGDSQSHTTTQNSTSIRTDDEGLGPTEHDEPTWEEIADDYEEVLEGMASSDDERAQVIGEFILERGGKR